MSGSSRRRPRACILHRSLAYAKHIEWVRVAIRFERPCVRHVSSALRRPKRVARTQWTGGVGAFIRYTLSMTPVLGAVAIAFVLSGGTAIPSDPVSIVEAFSAPLATAISLSVLTTSLTGNSSSTGRRRRRYSRSRGVRPCLSAARSRALPAECVSEPGGPRAPGRSEQ